MKPLRCPCTGKAVLRTEYDKEEHLMFYRVECDRCEAWSDPHVGPMAIESTVNQWNEHVEQGYVPHARQRTNHTSEKL